MITAFCLCLSSYSVLAKTEVRLKELCRLADARSNQLVGYGLIVGLDGTGDDAGTFFTPQSLVNLFQHLGVKVDKDKMKVKNVAAVMVTAELPPFARLGDKIDITVSALGNASDLRGGILLQTPLQGADNQVYAVAQGQVTVGMAGKKRRGTGLLSTVASIKQGAIIEKEIPSVIVSNNTVSLILHQPDFTTASRIVDSINSKFSPETALAKDASTIVAKLPAEYKNNEVGFIAALEEITVSPDRQARIVINEQSGTVVMGGDICIQEVAVSHGNLSLNIRKPITIGKKETFEVIKEQVMVMQESVSINDIVKALNTIGASPRDVIAVLEAIKKAGALHAQIELM